MANFQELPKSPTRPIWLGKRQKKKDEKWCTASGVIEFDQLKEQIPRKFSIKLAQPSGGVSPSTGAPETRECDYCYKLGHILFECPALKCKEGSKASKKVHVVAHLGPFDPVSVEKGGPKLPMTILCDTGAAQSFLVKDVLPLSDMTYCGSDVLVQDIVLRLAVVPLHHVYLQTEDFSGYSRNSLCVI